jgi:hypothetical protein
MARGALKFFLFFIVVLCLSEARAQESADSLMIPPPRTKSPKVAVIRSAVLPGWGQWYNEQKLKSLLVFGAEAALIGNAVYYNQLAVKGATDDERRFYQDVRGRFLWWLIAAHLINVLDAYVDAHLWNFDVGPDLAVENGLVTNRNYLLKLEIGLWIVITLIIP